VLGAVAAPGRAAIPSGGIRLLDLLAQAGGTSQSPWEIKVGVQRASASATLSLSEVFARPQNNIVILPGDIVNVTHIPRRFAVYGGVVQPGNVEIPLEKAHLAYLLAEVGGLNDNVAQARSVYVFRPSIPANRDGAPVGLAYRLDFSKPDAFLLAGMFRLEPTDITYIESADGADFQRFASVILSPLLGAASGARGLTN
jgi:polysaccharide export outer membrane protein